MTQPLSLTHDEARARADLLRVHHYDLHFDLTGLADGPELLVESTVRFDCTSPGAETFVDIVGEVLEATLNGRRLPAGIAQGGRLQLTDLAAENVLTVRSRQTNTGRAEGVHRVVDASDQRVYFWMSLEPDDARRAFACFDQPDLKAVFSIRVTAPPAWTVTSNSGSPEVEGAAEAGGARVWTFADTPALSTYLVVVDAGEMHEIRSVRDGRDLGLYCRASLAPILERDAEELFDLTAKGLAFFGDRFGLPFGQRTYDQVFLPDLGGAMENYGCVTWTDTVLYRDPPSAAQREVRATVLLHEMAHMWFGDMVTLRWWDDLWLNESFAEWACHWAAEQISEFTEAWAATLAARQQMAYAADLGPTTHPIRQPIPDVAAAEAAFDNITYPKGCAALKQLTALLGEDAFLAGLRAYFERHAWGNTTLDDLVHALEEVSGRDLSGWVKGWLESPGVDVLVLERAGGNARLRVEPPEGRGPLQHRLDIGVYDDADGSLVRRDRVAVEAGTQDVVVPDLGNADLLLVNDDDLTYARVRPDAPSLARMLEHAGQLPDTMSRTLAVTGAWQLMFTGEIGAAEFVSCAVDGLARETSSSVMEPMLTRAVEAADYWAPARDRHTLQAQVADLCVALAEQPAHRVPAVRALARTAVERDHFEALDRLADRADLRWARLTRLAELGELDPAEVERLEAEDTNPEAWASALAARTATADAAAKREAWDAIFTERKIMAGNMRAVGLAFWRPGQADLLAPYAAEFLELMPRLGEVGMLMSKVSTATMYPRVGVGAEYPGELAAATDDDRVSAAVRQTVLELADRLARMLATRGR